LGSQPRDEFLDLPLALVRGGLEQVAMVLGHEMRRQQSHRREVHRSVAEQFEDDGVFPNGPSRLNAAIGGMLGEMEHLHAVGEHG